MADGTVIKNTWEIVGEIGAGGMGTVYEVRHVRLGKRYALKQLKQEFADRPDVKHRFDREAMTMAELQHPHIVQVYDIDVEPNFGAFILMDLINGSNLGKIIREQGPRPYSEVLRIGSEIASALDFAHRRGVVHRDIKPGNILIEEGTGRAVLTDFGIAKQLNPDSDETEGTKTGVFIGTYRYSSPEQMRNEDPDPRWDIYSFGIVLYEAFSGNRFLENMTEGQVVAHVAYMPDWRPSLDCPQDPPAEFLRVMESCLERDRDKRTASASELVEQLAECRKTAPEEPITPSSAKAAPEAEELATAITQQESYTAIRATLRAEAEGQINRLRRLEEDLGKLGVSNEEWTSSGELGERLAAVGELEGKEQYNEAMAGLEALGERASEVYRSIEASLRETLGNGIAEVRERWGSLVERGGDLVPSAQGVELNQLTATAERCQASGDWTAGWRGLNEGQQLVDRATANALAQATSRVDANLVEAGKGLEALGEPPAELDLESIRTEIANLVAAGRLAEGVKRSEAFSSQVGRLVADLRQAQKDSATATRTRLEELLGRTDLTAAAKVAETLVAEGREAQERGAAAEKQEDFVGAAEAYDAACAALSDAAARLSAAEKEELQARANQLSALVARAEAGPQEIVGHAVSNARDLLAKVQAGNPAATLASVETVRTELEQAIETAAAFAAATERQQAADALQVRVSELSVPARDQKSARQSMKEAATAFKKKRWAEARDQYAQAEAAWAALVQGAEARDQAAREEAQRSEIQRRQTALQELLPATRRLQEEALQLDLSVPDVARIAELDGVLREVASQQERGQLDDALSSLATAEEQARAVRTSLEDSLEAKLADESAQLSERWQDVETRAGSLLPAVHAEGVAGCLSSAQQHVQARQWLEGWQELSEGRERIDRAESETAEIVRERVGELLAQAESHLEELQRAEASELVDGFDLSQLRSDVAARLDRGLYEEAGRLAASPVERLGAAVRQLRQTHEERLATIRSTVEGLAKNVQSPEAEAVAGNFLGQAREASSAAEEAERNGDYAEALRSYESAREAYEQVAGRVNQKRLDDLSAQVRARLEGAPSSLAEDSVQQARDALASSDASDPSAAMAALVKAREGLDAAFEQAKAQEEAERARALELEEARRRLQGLIDQSSDLPPEVAGGPVDRAKHVLDDARAKLPAVEEAELHLQQAREESAAFLAAEEARQAAKAEEQAVLGGQPKARALKPARKRMAEADGAFEKRQWKHAADAYRAASAALASVKTKAVPSAAPATGAAPEIQKRSPVAAIVGAAAAVLVAGAVIYLRPWAEPAREEQPQKPDVEAEVPAEAPPKPEVAAKPAQEEQPKPDVAVNEREEAAPPPAEVAAPFSIASASPSAPEVSVPEAGRKEFSVEVKGGKEGESPPIEWTLGGTQVAKNATTYEYEPDYDAARSEPYDLTVRFGTADAPIATHSWKVRVEPVNRDPILVDTAPRSGQTVREKPGATVNFSVNAKDADGDELQYAWTVGGKPVAEKGPKLKLKVARSEQVAVTVRDGVDGKALTASWNVEAEKVEPTIVVAALPPFELLPRPSSVSRLQLQEAATFELVTPKDLSAAKIDYQWTVDGRKVSGGRTFRFDNRDAALVKGKPVRIRVDARDDKKRSFKHEWNVNIVPPPPKITSAQPAASSLDLAPGASQGFEVEAASPVGNQVLTYVFRTNGKESTSTKPRYDFVAGGQQEYTIVASIRDNYEQTSKETRTWQVRVASQADVDTLVKDWLDRCQAAFNQKNVAKLAELLRLDSGKQKSLEGVLKNQRGLRVAFRDVKIDKVDSTRAAASYNRVDEFVDERTGKSISLSTPVKQKFQVENGRVVLVKK